jgi:hypothetical protein
MINAAAILFFALVAQSTDQSVFSSAERFFLQNDFTRAKELIDSHSWADNSIWSKAGLIRELCDGGWNIACPAMTPSAFRPCSCFVTVSLKGVFNSGDSVRVFLPIPAELPWQVPSAAPEISITGISGAVETEQGWLSISGLADSSFEITVMQSLFVDPHGFAGIDAAGTAEAMVPFPGEDLFLDTFVNTDAFWIGEDIVYLESVRLAEGEPNPMRLVLRVINAYSAFYAAASPVNEQVLLLPASGLALQGDLQNSMGGASLGAAVLRRWQIPSIVVPGRWGSGTNPGFLLAVYVKPFGWMIVSPFPEGFTAMGSFDPPQLKSWFNGLSGVSFQAEYLGEDNFWHAIPLNAPGFSHSVEITIQ